MLTGKPKLKLIDFVFPNSIESDNTKSDTLSTLSYFDPILKLYNLQEIQMLENNFSKIKKIELIYFNKDKIHNNLYRDEQFININSDENTNSLTYCFYLCKLINDKKANIKYIYNTNYINDIFIKINGTENHLKKIIFSKIIIVLIHNYKGTEKYNERQEEELSNILTICEDNINNYGNLDLTPTINDIKIKILKKYIVK